MKYARESKEKSGRKRSIEELEEAKKKVVMV